jgi:hypothetical protein
MRTGNGPSAPFDHDVTHHCSLRNCIDIEIYLWYDLWMQEVALKDDSDQPFATLFK